MPSNIEIKAKAVHFTQQKQIAERISDSPGKAIYQEDIFFQVPQGRLKLRILSPNEGELIYYEREDKTGPKRSQYQLTLTHDPTGLNETLRQALGVLGTVRKKRTLFLVDQTRIHLDEVEGLGEFIELEVVLRPEQSTDEGIRIAEELMEKLHISPENLIEGAYMDMLLQKQNESRSQGSSPH